MKKLTYTLPLKATSLLGCLLTAGSITAQAGDYGSVVAKTRMISFDREFENSNSDRSQTALGFELKYDSVYWNDFIGVGIAGYHVQELDSSGAERSDILTRNNDGHLDNQFSQIGEAYIKLKLGEDTQVKVGRQRAKTVFILSSGTRAIPNTFRGISAQTRLNNTRLYAVAFDEWSRRHDDRFEGFKTDQSEEGDIDWVWAVGAEYQKEGLKLGFEHQVSTDYLRKFGVLGSYTWPLGEAESFKLSGGFFTSEDDGDLFVTGAEGGDYDDEDLPGSVVGVTRSENDGEGYYVDLEWKIADYTLGFAYTVINDTWIEDSYSGDHGRNPFPTRAEISPDFTATNEKSWQIRLGYNWQKFVPGLTTQLRYNEGNDAENSVDAALGTADEYYTQLDTRWNIPYVKGLKLRWLYQSYHSSEKGSVDSVKPDDTDHRVYLDYTYKF